ncbi:MAG: 30S ribosomal protein S5 [Planctomycetes bacterium]|nr:30S ribosomal protein S5 [Planctomycetota bacterium]
MANEQQSGPAGQAGDKKGRGKGGNGPRQRDSRSKLYEEEVVRINRCDKVVKGGKRSSFSAFIVLGDGKGKVGYGYAKARQVPSSIDKAVRAGEKNVRRYPIVKGTIPHLVEGRFGASRVRLIPAAEGTGVIAGKTVRAVLEKLGVHNILTKSYGSNNPGNLVKATIQALEQLRTQEQYEELRGLKL